jgi:hypothetical protein
MVHFINNWRSPHGADGRVISFAPFNFWVSWGGSTFRFCIGACVLNLGVEWLSVASTE